MWLKYNGKLKQKFRKHLSDVIWVTSQNKLLIDVTKGKMAAPRKLVRLFCDVIWVTSQNKHLSDVTKGKMAALRKLARSVFISTNFLCPSYQGRFSDFFLRYHRKHEHFYSISIILLQLSPQGAHQSSFLPVNLSTKYHIGPSSRQCSCAANICSVRNS